MTGRERVRRLRATDLFRDRSEPALRMLLPHFDEVTVRAGERLALEGRLCHQLLVGAQGRLRTCSRGVEGELGAGDTFGWSAMRERGLNEASVFALTDCRLLVMSHEQFRAVEPPPTKGNFRFWALPTSRRSLPHRQHLQASVEARKTGADPAC